MCFGGDQQQIKAAEAPPAPEATPEEEVMAPEETIDKGNDRKQKKIKGTGLDNYRTDLGVSDKGTGLNVAK